jgi:hypothetical protein
LNDQGPDRAGGAGNHNQGATLCYSHFHPHLLKYRYMLTINIQVILTFL